MHTIKPLDEEALNGSLEAKLVVAVEEHGIIGGLGSAIAEYMSALENAPPVLRIGLPDEYMHAGEYEYLIGQAGLTAESIYLKIKERLRMGCLT
jgi:transketolase